MYMVVFAHKGQQQNQGDLLLMTPPNPPQSIAHSFHLYKQPALMVFNLRLQIATTKDWAADDPAAETLK